MRAVLVSAAVLGVAHVAVVPAASAAAAASAPGNAPRGGPATAAPDGEGAYGGRGVVLARAGAAPLLGPSEARQSPLVAVGEGGEGGRGKWRGRRDRDYGYAEPYRYREPYGWAPPPRYGYAPPPPPWPHHGGWAPEPPPRFYAPRPPSAGGWIDPGS